MSLFNRKSKTDNPIPEDLQPYYSGQSGVSRWVGPVLRAGILLVVVALLVWGGIWSVNKIINRGSNQAQTASTSKSDDNKASGSSSNDNNDSTSKSNGATTKTPTPVAPAPSTPSPTPSTPAPAATPAPVAVTPTPTPTPTPGQGSGSTGAVTPPAANGQALVNTGPGDAIAAAALTTIVAGIGYRVYLVRRLSRQ